jgi:MFS family permease
MRQGLFYGWWVLATLFLSGLIVFGGGVYSFILMVPVLTREFHWSRAVSGGLVSTFWIVSPVALLGSVFIKRYGIRRVLAVGVVIESLSVFAFSMTASLPLMFVLRALMGLGKVLFAVTVPVAVGRWFSRRFGLGCAIAWAGWHTGGLVLSPLTGSVIESYGWRTACQLLSAGIIVVGLLPAFWALRVESPQGLGLGRDGAPCESSNQVPREDLRNNASIYRFLLSSRLFWLIAVATAAFFFVYAGTLIHQSALVQESGIPARIASFALGSTAAFAVCGALGMGWLADRWTTTGVAVVEHVLLIGGVLGLLIFAKTSAVWALLTHILLFGLAIGGGDVFFAVILKRRFGDDNFATAYSIWYFFCVVTLWAGPIVAGYLYDKTGTYVTALLVLLTASGVSGLVSLLAAIDRSTLVGTDPVASRT